MREKGVRPTDMETSVKSDGYSRFGAQNRQNFFGRPNRRATRAGAITHGRPIHSVGVCDIMQIGEVGIWKRDPQPPPSVLHRSHGPARESDAWWPVPQSRYQTIRPLHRVRKMRVRPTVFSRNNKKERAVELLAQNGRRSPKKVPKWCAYNSPQGTGSTWSMVPVWSVLLHVGV